MAGHPHHHGHHHDHGGLGHHHHHHGRDASRRALVGALIVLSVLFVVEIVGGWLTNSLALLSDAGHLLTDVVAVAIAIAAQVVAQRPASAKRSYGYRRVEIIAALFNGLTLVLVAGFIVFEAVDRFQEPPPVDALPMLVIAAVGFVAQLLAALILVRASGESLNVRGAYVHAMTDALQSIGVVIAGVVILTTGYVLVDPIISVVIGVFIAWSGGRIVVEAVHVLLEGTPADVDLRALAERVEAHEGVCRVSDLHVWSLTTGYNALSAHVISDDGLDAVDRERLRAELAHLLRHEFSLHHLTLQVEEACAQEENGSCNDWR